MSGLTWKDVDINHLNLADREVYKNIYQSGNTIGIFQMESADAKKMLMEAKADSIEDIVVVNAANRPGTKDSFPEYCFNKLNPDKVKLLHPDIKKLFGGTQYILLYQEEALSVFRYAGFPEEEVDQARRAIGHKEKDTMKSLEAKLREGLKSKGWKDFQISEMWSLLQKQSGYSFNASHAVAYGLLSYLTAYLKTHFPVQFMTACLIAKTEDTGKIGVYINECNRLGIKVLPPNVNKSELEFSPMPEKKKILFGLNAIKGIGRDVSKQIIVNRPYSSFEEFLEKNSTSKLNIAMIVNLIKAGAIPTKDKKAFMLRYADKLFNESYKEKPFKELATLPTLKELREKWAIDTNLVIDKKERLKLYNQARRKKFDSEKLDRAIAKEKKRREFSAQFSEKYMQNEHMWEFETLSMFLTVNPLAEFSKYVSKTLDDTDVNANVVILAVIVDIQRKKDKRGSPFAYLHLYTTGGIVEVVCWSSQYKLYQPFIKKGNDIAVLCKKKEDAIEVKQIKSYTQWLKDRKLKGA